MKKITWNKAGWLAIGLAGMLVCMVTDAWAVNVTWTGTADNNLDNADNWTGGTPNNNTWVFNSSTLPVTGSLTLTSTSNYSFGGNTNWMLFNAGGTTAYTISGGTATLANNSFILNNSDVTQRVDMTLNIGGNRLLINNGASHAGVELGTVVMTNNAILSVASEWNTYGLLGATLTVDRLDFTGANTIILQGRQVSSTLYRPDYADLPQITIGNLAGTGQVNANSNIWGTLTLNGVATPAAAAGTQFNLSANARLVLDYTGTDAAKLGGRQLVGNLNNTVVLRGGSASAGETGQLYTVGRTRFERDGGAATYMATSIGFDGNVRGVYDLAAGGIVGYNGTDVTYFNYSTGNGDSHAVAPWVTIGGDSSSGRDFAKRNASNLFVALEADDYTPVVATTWSNTANGLLTGGYSNANIRVGNLKITGDPASGELADNTLQIQDAGALQMLMGGLIFTGTSDYLITGGKIGINWGGALYVWQSGQGTLTISSTISGPMSAFVKAGAGTLVLDADNGAAVDVGFRANPRISILDGTLLVGHDHALGRADSNVTVTGTLDLNGHNVTVQSLFGSAYYGALVTNSAAEQATLTVTSTNNTPGNIGYGFFQYGNLSGNTRVIVDMAGLDISMNMNVANDFDGGIEFRNNVTAADGAANLFTRRSSINGTRIYHYQAFGTGAVTLSGTATVLSLSMGTDGNSLGLANDFIISGTHMIGLDAAAKFNGAFHGGADDVLLLTNNFTGGDYTLNGDMTGFSGTIYTWLNYPRDSRFRQIALKLNAGVDLSNASVVLAQSGSGNDAAANYNYFVARLELNASGTYQVGGLSSAFIDNSPGGDGAMTPYMNAGGDVFVRSVGGNGAYTLEVGARGNANDIFDGHITNQAAINQDASIHFINWTDTDVNHVTTLNKVGTGTLTLTNLNTYSGTTMVSGGVLLVSGTGNLSRTTAVTVSGGTLQLTDSGTIANPNTNAIEVTNGALLVDTAYAWTRNVNLNADGVLGGSGTINTSNIEFKTASAGVTGGELGKTGTLIFDAYQGWQDFTYHFDILSAADHDLLIFNNDLDLFGDGDYYNPTYNTTIAVNAINGLDSLANFDDLIILSGLSSDVTESMWHLDQAALDAGFTFSISADYNLLLNYIAIPEPSAWLLLSAGATLLVFLRRRR
ncbi:MAG: autotransporter-associated beta strand repeat-containing protein [Verrucomicrobiales bacterium]|jgi:autotransporter-associated beta strand protein|nr:autotransporter-associated beta strand repeat-containing protein [Verrucomicrobiales bacterium]